MSTSTVKLRIVVTSDVEVELLDASVGEDMTLEGGNENIRRIMRAVQQTPSRLVIVPRCTGCGEYHVFGPDTAHIKPFVIPATGQCVDFSPSKPQQNAPTSECLQ